VNAVAVEHVDEVGVQLVAVLDLAECHSVALGRPAGKCRLIRGALSDIGADAGAGGRNDHGVAHSNLLR